MLGEVCATSPAEWSVLPIEHVCTRVTSGGTPSRSNSQYYIGGQWPWVKTQELLDCWIDDTEEHITADAIASSSAKVLPGNTVLLALYGATVGQLGLLRRPMTCNQACCAMLVDDGRADFRYLYYQLRLHRRQLKQLATGAAQQNLSGAIVKCFQLPFPSLPEQRTIASVLGSLDDKIELNRRMNRTLEQMAAAIFKAWFVDFEPVRAKASGAASFPGMPQPVFDALPAAFVDSELGSIPEGWEVGRLKDAARLTMGQSPKSEFYNTVGEGLPFHQGVTNYGERFPTHKTYCTVADRIAEVGDILFSVRAPVGRINVADERLIVGRGLAALRHNQGWQSYLLYALKHQFADEDTIGDGTIFKAVTKKDMEGIRIIGPDEVTGRGYETIVEVMDQQIGLNDRESRTLAETRDTLLPKLLSGEVRLHVAQGEVSRSCRHAPKGPTSNAAPVPSSGAGLQRSAQE